MSVEDNPKRPERPRRRPSIFWPLILITLGVIFLLNNVGVIQGTVWDTILRLWPLLFIAIGLDGVYRGEGLVGSTFMIGIGAVFLLANLGYLTLNVWRLIITLWPLLLVAFGFDILIGRRSLVASLIGLVAILAILAGALWVLGVRVDRGQQLAGQEISQPIDGAERARIILDPAVGNLHVQSLSGSDALITGTVSSGRGVGIEQNLSRNDGEATYTLSGFGATTVSPLDGDAWDWELSLTSQIPLSLKVSLGAGASDIDLTNLELDGLEVSMGVGQTKVTLPDEGLIQGKVDGAIGQTLVYVPEGVGLRLISDTGIATVSVPTGYTRNEDVYTSPNYNSAESSVELNVSQAIGVISVAPAR
jgi:predicted membrane protein